MAAKRRKTNSSWENGRCTGKPTEDMCGIRETHAFQRTLSERYGGTQDDRSGHGTLPARRHDAAPGMRGLLEANAAESCLWPADLQIVPAPAYRVNCIASIDCLSNTLRNDSNSAWWYLLSFLDMTQYDTHIFLEVCNPE
jgi:hypothetical protein